MTKKKKIPIFVIILVGMVLGVGWGLLAVAMGWKEFTIDWVKPFGTIFLKLLKLVAVPLIFVSLVKGISSLSDISKLSRLGLKTLALYLVSTVIAVSFGLVLVNLIAPGKAFPEKVRTELMETYKDIVDKKLDTAEEEKTKGPLSFVENLVPDNIVSAATDNKQMLQIIFFAVLFGIAMVLLPAEKTKVVSGFFDGLNDIILKIINIIMKYAPVGVFALMAGLIVEIAGDDLSRTVDIFSALGLYSLTVILGLAIMIIIIYPSFLAIFTPVKFKQFYQGIFSAQIVAFSTSSSAATLPVTMKCCEENLGIDKEISSFVLPIGATVNMDGTSLYQAVAAVFIAQAFGYDLTIGQQLIIILTATLASIGSAAVPSAGIIMLIIVLESIGVPSAGIALILAIDRPLDMLRTIVNITGDTVVATIVAKSEGKLGKVGL